MKIMTYSESRANYAKVLDSVIDDQEEVVIARSGKESVVMIPLREWESIKETMYLMSNRKNHEWLLESIDQHRRGLAEVHELLDT